MGPLGPILCQCGVAMERKVFSGKESPVVAYPHSPRTLCPPPPCPPAAPRLLPPPAVLSPSGAEGSANGRAAEDVQHCASCHGQHCPESHALQSSYAACHPPWQRASVPSCVQWFGLFAPPVGHIYQVIHGQHKTYDTRPAEESANGGHKGIRIPNAQSIQLQKKCKTTPPPPLLQSPTSEKKVPHKSQ